MLFKIYIWVIIIGKSNKMKFMCYFTTRDSLLLKNQQLLNPHINNEQLTKVDISPN
mgnify:CR=1 FL=1